MNYTTRRNISLLVSALLLIGALGVFFGLDWPAFAKVREVNKKIAQEQAQYNEQFQAVQTAKSIINQYRGLASVSQTISLSVPRGPEIQNVVAQIDNLAIASGLSVQSINFETPSVPTLKQKSSKNLTQENRILKITLTLDGSYESFKTWLASAESNIRLMDIKNIAFASLGGANPNRFSFKVGMEVYYQ